MQHIKVLFFFWALLWLGTASAQSAFQNPGFETGSLSPWTGTGEVTNVNRMRSGQYSAYIGHRAYLEQTITGLVVGNTYEIKGWIWPRGTGTLVQFGVRNYSATGNPVQVLQGSTAGYVEKTISFTAGQTSATFYYKRADMGSAWAHIDDVTLVNTSPTVTIAATASGSGSVTGGRVYSINEAVVLSAVPNANQFFLYWQEGDQIVSYDPLYTFTAATDRTLTAVFSPTTLNNIGMGINSAKDYEEGPFIFADAMKHSRQWIKLGTNSTPAQVDANGWPQENAIAVVACQIQLHGLYKISFKGQARPTLTAATTSNLVYDAGTNTTTADILVTNAADHCLFLVLNQMAAGGVSDIRLMRPQVPGSTESYAPTTTFTDQIKTTLKRVCSVRYMDYNGANSDDYNLETSWEARVRPGYATQAVGWRMDNYQRQNVVTGKNWYDYQGKGGAWEYVAMLANETNTDAWICIPHAASDDYILKIAQAFRYGTDGVNPYTSPQANPVFPPLNPQLKLYVEYSNEVWNTSFPVFNYMWNQLQMENPVTSDLYFDGSTNANYLRYRYAARRTVQISNIFRSVFGDAEMITRVRPLMEWQKGKTASGLGNTNYSGSAMLMYIDATQPEPVDYYLYGAGPSGYYQATPPNEDPTVTIDNVWDKGEFVATNWAYPIQEWAVYLTSCYGLRRVVYEGGPSLGDQNATTSEIHPFADDIIADPRITQEIVEHQQVWDQVGGDLFSYFVLGADARWGFMSNPFDFNSYKMQGIDAIKNKPRAPITNGAQITPTTNALFAGDQWRISNLNDGGWQTPNTSISTGTYSLPLFAARPRWVSYHFHASTTANDYKARIHYRSTTGATLELFIGSRSLGTFTLPPTATTVTSPWASFTSDQHNVQALRVQLNAGNLTIYQAEVAGAGFNFQNPIAPPR